MSARYVTVIEGPRRSLIGEPCNAGCECGWKGTVYAFGDERTRVENARRDRDAHARYHADAEGDKS